MSVRKVDWSLAACLGTDPEVFFDPALESVAVGICTTCPIRQEGLMVALERPGRLRVAAGRWDGRDLEALEALGTA